MNIALVILHADAARGGAERYTIDLAAALVGRGHRVSLAASSFVDRPKGARCVELPARAATRLGRYLRFLDSLDTHLSAEPYEVVHAMLPVRRCDVYHPHAGVAADAIACGHLKHDAAVARLLSHAANRLNRKRRRFAAVERDLLTGVHSPLVLCLSEYVKGAVRRHYAMADSALVTLFNAIDLGRFDPSARPQAGAEVRRRFDLAADDVTALMIAQDYHRKGLHIAIDALAETRDARLKLLVVGKQDPAPYRRLAERRGVEKQVIFAGTTTDPVAFHQAAELFVLPTRHDPCSLATLEAVAMGKPVLSTLFNGACEILVDGVHGSVLPDPTDVAALAKAMKHWLDDARRRRASAACLKLRPMLSYERHLDDLIQIYHSATFRRGG